MPFEEEKTTEIEEPEEEIDDEQEREESEEELDGGHVREAVGDERKHDGNEHQIADDEACGNVDQDLGGFILLVGGTTLLAQLHVAAQSAEQLESVHTMTNYELNEFISGR